MFEFLSFFPMRPVLAEISSPFFKEEEDAKKETVTALYLEKGSDPNMYLMYG